MASYQYTRGEAPEPQQPPQPQAPMTKQQKWENFWFYHKWHVIIALAAVVMVAMFVNDFVNRERPDYQIGVITHGALPTGTLDTLEQQLAQFADDRNGDGKVQVTLMQYDFPEDGDPNTIMASTTRLSGDLEVGDCVFYLVDDVEYFQERFGFFAYNDGARPPEEGPYEWDKMGVAWRDCPVLMQMDLGKVPTLGEGDAGDVQDVLQEFTLVKRIVQGSAIEKKEKVLAYLTDGEKLWDAITAREG